MYWRSACSDENTPTDCGWWYWDDWNYSEFWVTCDEFAEWTWCTGEDYYYEDYCDYEWYWDDCWYGYYRVPCQSDYDYYGSYDGWVYWDDWSYVEYFVTYDDWSNWCSDYYYYY